MCRVAIRGLGRIVLIGCVAGLAAGCGSQTYERRLNETAKYFEYLDKLDRNLVKNPWRNSGIELRVPKQFKLLPLPTTKTDRQGQPLPPQEDDRHRENPIHGLPGLLGVWRGEVAVDDHEQKVPCHLYVLSNHHLWLAGAPGEEALRFHVDAVAQLAGAFDLPMPAEEQWSEELIPPTLGYVEKKSLARITLRPPRPIDAATAEVSIYVAQAGDIRVVLVFVVPQAIDPLEKMHEQIPLSLETLAVSDKKPRKGGKSKAAEPGF